MRDHAPTALKGTPVVGGIAYGPALWPGERPVYSPSGPPTYPRVSVTPRRIGSSKPLPPSRDGCERASHSSGVAAEVLSATAGPPGGSWLGVRGQSGSPSGRGLRLRRSQQPRSSRHRFTKLGGLDGRTRGPTSTMCVTAVAELLGVPETSGVPVPDTVDPGRRRSGTCRYRVGFDPSLVTALRTRLGGTDQPYRDHRAPAGHPVRRGSLRVRRRGGGHHDPGRRHHRRHRDRNPMRNRHGRVE